jgi:hypothetical protein
MEKNKIKIINFNASYEVPNYKYDAKRNLIHWGSDNAYPDYLLDVYNAYGSTTHKAIVNRKTKLTAGQGWKDVQSPELEKFIKDNNLNKEVRKVSLDYELYNGFALEIIWNREGTEISSVSHVPFHKLRIGIESEEIPFEHYWYSDDWSKYKKPENEPNMYRAWNPYVNITLKQMVYTQSQVTLHQ